MPRKTRSAYGSWPSPLQVEQMLQSSVGLSDLQYHDGELLWNESRPSEKGRCVIIRRHHDGSTFEVTPPEFSAVTRVHEYGGSCYTSVGLRTVFSNAADQQLYKVIDGETPVALTSEKSYRFAAPSLDASGNRVLCIVEHHPSEGCKAEAVVNFIGAVDLFNGQVSKLVEGADFYGSPSLSPDRKWLAWVEWNHPNMPWDDTTLWVGKLAADGTISEKRQLAGGSNESVMDPQWSRDSSTLYFVSDRSDFWNLYAVVPSGTGRSFPVAPLAAEFGGPMWQLGGSSYAILDDGSIACTYNVRGLWHLGLVTQAPDGEISLQEIDLPYTALASITSDGSKLAMVAGSASSPPAIIEIDVATKQVTVVKRSSSLVLDQAYVSKPKVIAVPSTDGATTYALFYAPKNPKFRGHENERPPLMVMSHGGPTSSANSSFSFLVQYYTSRGFAVADVNYRGSTGFGRKYRNELRGRWGVVDWQDCEAVATYLAKKRKVDRKRLAIRGGSAGGYTTLGALAWGTKFHAGASHYGVGDLNALAGDTHKFESRYLDSLIGPYDTARELYDSRSPINAADKFDCPVIFFQGTEDKIVPPNQSETMVAALKNKGLPVSYIAFEGERHGFRQAPNIKRAIQAEFLFYSKIFGFAPADQIDPLEIHNFAG